MDLNFPNRNIPFYNDAMLPATWPFGFTSFVCALLLVCTTQPVKGQDLRFVQLGQLEATNPSSTAAGLSSDGQIIVGSSKYGTKGSSLPFIWRSGTGLEAVEIPASENTEPQGGFSDVSGDGQTFVGSINTEFGTEAMRWTAASGATTLGRLYSGERSISGLTSAVSEDGSVIVGRTFQDVNLENTDWKWAAFKWTESAGIKALPDLILNGASFANDVSADGNVVVGQSDFRPTRWVGDGAAEALVNTFNGINTGEALGISRDGSKIVGRIHTDNEFAFLWTQETGMKSLGIPDGYTWSYAKGISDDGSIIVGTINSPTTGSFAAIWTESTGWQTINDLLSESFDIDLQGLRLAWGNAISSDGNIVVGYAQLQFGQMAWRADVGCVPGVGKRPAAECTCNAPLFTWLPDQGATFSFADNWNPAGPPSESSIARFESADFVPVVFISPATTDGLEITNGQLSFEMDEQEYITKGQSGCGPDLFISGADTKLTLKEKGFFESQKEVMIGQGSLIVQEQSVLLARELNMGETDLSLLKIDGAAMRVTDKLSMAQTELSTSNLTVSGTAPDSALLVLPPLVEIGKRGTAYIYADGKTQVIGPIFDTPGNLDLNIKLGIESGSAGFLNFVGPDIRLFDNQSNPNLRVNIVAGEGGVGSFFLEKGANLHLYQMIVGESGLGTVNINDGSTLITEFLQMGLFPGGIGQLTVSGEENTSAIILPLAGHIGSSGKGTLQMEGKSLITNVFETIALPVTLVLGFSEEGEGNLIVTGSDASIESDPAKGLGLTVGHAGRGDVQITNGGKVDVGEMWISKLETGFGSTFVGGGGAQLITEKLAVGAGAFGLLQVEEDGIVTTGQLWVAQNGQIQGNVIAVGTVTSPSKMQTGAIVTSALLLSDNAQLDVASIEMGEDAIIGGTASWPTPILNTGSVSPGDFENPAGAFKATAGYEQTASGKLMIDIGPNGADQLIVTGTASLGGILEINVLPAYSLTSGEEFSIVLADALSGAFTEVKAQEGLEVAVSYTSDRVTLRVLDYVVLPVGIEETIKAALPAAYHLYQNYPNPFNPQTVIGYEIAAPGQVLLSVYDLLGREVERLVDQIQTAGRYEVVFEANKLPSGTYLYRLTTPGHIATRRMALVR